MPAKRKPKAEPEIELRPDGWARFEAAVGAAIKSGPKHRGAVNSALHGAKQRGKPSKSATKRVTPRKRGANVRRDSS